MAVDIDVPRHAASGDAFGDHIRVEGEQPLHEGVGDTFVSRRSGGINPRSQRWAVSVTPSCSDLVLTVWCDRSALCIKSNAHRFAR
jgi:hypothetical protein